MMNTTLEMRTLGKTSLQVTPIGLGMMEFAGGRGFFGRMFPVIPQEENNHCQGGSDGGLTWFDTAEMYGNGVSEQSLAPP